MFGNVTFKRKKAPTDHTDFQRHFSFKNPFLSKRIKLPYFSWRKQHKSWIRLFSPGAVGGTNAGVLILKKISQTVYLAS